MKLEVVARVRNDFASKFGLPRQSGMICTLESTVVFESAFRNPDMLRGLEGFTHIWLIWGFSETKRAVWSPTVRPPRLGGNTRMGVFATRSPFRPNPLGLSCVELKTVNLDTPSCPTLTVLGADMTDGTPVYDIKPYLPYADSVPHAEGGYAHDAPDAALAVEFPDRWLRLIPQEKQATLLAALSGDPRPAYQENPERIYGFGYAGFDIRFQVKDDVLTVVEVVSIL
ncbi:MAG: tRNA (N6-threonylcarbamoyladenosine(37)-N6)-methyltransferase TrmO [Clostridiales bacterium]|nr:tRNA (N6-threonylcarbamoyladenosine(37)-N6)-methyltransferase TrmO [Clostridiales bacterium]